MLKKSVSLGIFCAATFVAVGTSHGQQKDPVSAGILHRFAGDIDGGGEVSVARWDVNAGIPLVSGKSGFAALSVSHAVDSYDFSKGPDLWGRVSTTTLGLPFQYKVSDNWNWSSVLRLRSAVESGGKQTDSYTYGIVTSLNYRVSDTLVIGPGFGYFTQLEDSDSIYPIISVKWDFANRWRLSTGPSEGANSGANIYVQYDLSDSWDLLVGASYQNRRFRLSSTSALAVDGVGEDASASLYFVAKYAPQDKDLSVSLIAGFSTGQEYNLFTTTGATISETDADGAPFLGLRLSYDF